MRRWLVRTALALLALVAIAAGAVGYLAYGSLPTLTGEARLAGLKAPATVVRDTYGVPHITAASETDAYAALGFVHAQDRLFQMELHRRIGQGRLAEMVGAPGLRVDRFIRTLGLYQLAELQVAAMDADKRALLDAYVGGINAFLAQRHGPLPPEFLLLRATPEPWTAADSLVWAKLMALDLSGDYEEDLVRARLAQKLTAAQMRDLWPDQPADTPITLASVADDLAGMKLDRIAAAMLPSAAEGVGSNEWVVDGTLTRTGGPLLANDPHLSLEAPGPWYLVSLEAPGLSVVGGTLPPLPFIVLGRNADIAWGFTNTGPDTQDLFVERVDPTDPTRYLAPGGSEPFTTRTETILVNGAAAEQLVVRRTRHGPVISDLGSIGNGVVPAGSVLALAWTALDPDDGIAEAGFRLSRAKDWASFTEALSFFGSPQQNVSYADRTGNIGFYAAGRLPIRRAGDGTLPVPGWDGAYDWTGTVPFADLPHAFDPPSHRFFNANNRIAPPGYPHLVSANFDPAQRARRIEELLTAGVPHDRETFAAMQADIVSNLARDFRPAMVEALPQDTVNAELKARMLAWDGTMRADAPEPLVFAAWYRALGRAVYADELGELYGQYAGLRPDFMARVLRERQVWCDDVTTPVVETCADEGRKAFANAMASLGAAYGADWRKWSWGEAHRIVMDHPIFGQVPVLDRLTGITVAAGGDGTTIDVAHAVLGADPARFDAKLAVSYRTIMDLADPDNSVFIAATGQSGHPLSTHYRDMTRLWRDGEYVPMRLQAPAEAGATLHLVPG